MADALKVGVAGLGTVGASVVRLIGKHSAQLAKKTGKTLEVTAVSARDRTRDRGVDLSAMTWFTDPVEMAKTADIDIFVTDSPPPDTVRALCAASDTQLIVCDTVESGARVA